MCFRLRHSVPDVMLVAGTDKKELDEVVRRTSIADRLFTEHQDKVKPRYAAGSQAEDRKERNDDHSR